MGRRKNIKLPLALHLRDWETAQTLYASIPASSPLAAQAKAGLAEVEKARRANDDDEAVERAHRDLLKRMAATDAMIDAMPVSRFDLCRAHTLAACEALAACKKTEPNCAYLLNDCPMSEEPVSLKRTQLGECAEILSTLPCEGKEREIAKLASSVCKGIQLRTSRQLLPEGANSADKARQENKNSPSLDGVGINPQDVDRVIRQLGGGQ